MSSPALSGGRENHTSTLLQDGRVLVTGGDSRYSLHSLNHAEIYSPENATWAYAGAMRELRADLPEEIVGWVGDAARRFEVTRSEANRIDELDGEPAWPALVKHLELPIETEPAIVSGKRIGYTFRN